jgi:hypothetical protein
VASGLVNIIASNAVEHWYVYYKLPAAGLPALIPQLRALQADIADATGAEPRLQTRLDAPGGIATVMEIYDGVTSPARFSATLDSALAASGLPSELRTSRRTERFRDL